MGFKWFFILKQSNLDDQETSNLVVILEHQIKTPCQISWMTNVSMLLGRVETMRVLGILEDLLIAVFKSLERHDGRKGSSDISGV